MLRFISYDIVFQEIPGEVSLAINISNCPNICVGCHSPHLQDDIGEVLNEHVITELIHRYGSAVTCVCFMGGDGNPGEIEQLAHFVKHFTNGQLKTAWYSGKICFPPECNYNNFDYIKLGPYIKEYGALNIPTTNQKFYQIVDECMVDVTERFWKN
ncbi:MAG: anaerobic ribonucleoside-triphosphate reductase activating protein [Bacteroidales bacterium]|jgi:anaerobic ribonucleoside-triphosphate reductase activating protein|nr:anaerobic ribonucleoside-triphosphate reductase activating protein [Bacteroidales bacterium]